MRLQYIIYDAHLTLTFILHMNMKYFYSQPSAKNPLILQSRFETTQGVIEANQSNYTMYYGLPHEEDLFMAQKPSFFFLVCQLAYVAYDGYVEREPLIVPVILKNGVYYILCAIGKILRIRSPEKVFFTDAGQETIAIHLSRAYQDLEESPRVLFERSQSDGEPLRKICVPRLILKDPTCWDDVRCV